MRFVRSKIKSKALNLIGISLRFLFALRFSDFDFQIISQKLKQTVWNENHWKFLISNEKTNGKK